MDTIYEDEELTSGLDKDEFIHMYKKGFVDARIDKMGAINMVASGLVRAPGNVAVFWLGILLLILSIIGSFTLHWWLFILGILCMVIAKKVGDSIRINAIWRAVLSDEKLYKIAREKRILYVFLRPGADPLMYLAERSDPRE